MKNSHPIGLQMEDLAARYLEYKGYEVLARRYKGRLGEIDLVARQGDVLVFAEVKYRRDLSMGRPSLAVSSSKQQKIRRTAMQYLAEYGSRAAEQDIGCRFDVIELWQENGKYRVHHYKNAFEGEQNGF